MRHQSEATLITQRMTQKFISNANSVEM